jgi:mannose-1-phosphate guanylyltransferase / mannose-6-phosphate isomerase
VKEGYLWNSGNFMFRARLLLAEYEKFEPESLAAIVDAVERAGSDLGFITLYASSFARASAKAIETVSAANEQRKRAMAKSFRR